MLHSMRISIKDAKDAIAKKGKPVHLMAVHCNQNTSFWDVLEGSTSSEEGMVDEGRDMLITVKYRHVDLLEEYVCVS